ncbi:hypothetical protein DL89DRAFT_254214 [Linderina pennispora]|uniref:Uncharacterized protein n=1 Tax=Linderina pennispora TaxID=61395 RepID=A0A1Y1WLI6_9FUNG|nr:uncharacterized protein DL89DRAFT_254214 [Linderina pennispora]ORX74362.1 hypothetical protein DL89DRAFT_254214 [Linderina pennispora]
MRLWQTRAIMRCLAAATCLTATMSLVQHSTARQANFATTFETAYGSMRGSPGFDSGFSSAVNVAAGRSSQTMPGAAASCVTFQSVVSSAADQQHNAGGETVLATLHANTGFLSTASILNAAAVQMSRTGTSFGASRLGGGSFDKGLLWEALAPYPNQFPLHIKDSRTIIDTVSLISMVLDRHHFCYRFQMGPNKMRWVAKRVRKHQLALLCYVRNTIIAEIFVDYEKGYSPYGSALGPGGIGLSSNAASGESTPNGPGTDSTAVDVDDGMYPVITILPTAFSQLGLFDADVVESFIIFSGMQMLECLHL